MEGGLVFFSWGVVSVQWLGDCGGLECGQTVGGDGPKARSKDISQRAQSPRATSSSVRTGAWDGMQSRPPPNTSVLVPKVSSSPWEGRQT